MDTTTMMLLMMAMGGGRSNQMMPLLMVMMMGGLGGTTGGTTAPLGLTTDAMMVGMMPGMGTLGKYIVGGAGAVFASSLFKPKRRHTRTRYRTRYVYRGRRRY